MPASRNHVNSPETGSGESTATRIGGAPTDLSRLARLIAIGEVPWPDGLQPRTASELAAEVRMLRRFHLMRLIAKSIAADIARNDSREEPFDDQKPL